MNKSRKILKCKSTFFHVIAMARDTYPGKIAFGIYAINLPSIKHIFVWTSTNDKLQLDESHNSYRDAYR